MRNFDLEKGNQIISNSNSLLPFARAEANQGNAAGPIETKMRMILSALKTSQFEDCFDWSVYDKIAARYGEDQPRGGVVFNTTFKLVNHHATCSKCHYAFEIDTYGRGCVHNCIYCYAKETLTRHGYWNEPQPFPVNLANVRKVFYTVFETNKPSKWRATLEKRVPLRIGSMSDSFMWMDRKYKVTHELLKILKFYRYPYIIFTRSDLVGEDDYIEAMDRELACIQLSVSGGNEVLTKALEPGAPSVAERLKAVRRLSDEGFWTAVRLNPLFPMYPDGYFTDPDSVLKRFSSKELAPRFDLFDWDFIDQIAETRTNTLLAGFVRLSAFAIRNMRNKIGIDLAPFFKPELTQSYGDNRYSDSEIAFYYKMIQGMAVKRNVRFTTCYIGNGIKDYYKYQNLWSNKTDCCDVKGNVGAFKSSSQDVPWKERVSHAFSKESALASMKEELEFDKKLSDSCADRLNEVAPR